METKILQSLLTIKSYKNIDRVIWKKYCSLKIIYSLQQTQKLRIILLCNPCHGFGDVVFAIKLLNYIKEWYACFVVIGTTAPEMFLKMGMSESDLIPLNTISVSQCRRFGNVIMENPPPTSFDLILVAPLIADSAISQYDITKLISYATKFNTFFFSEYNDKLDKGFDFNTGVGQGRDGVLMTTVPNFLNKFKNLGVFALAYVAENIDHSEICFMNFLSMITVKYTEKEFSVVVPTWMDNVKPSLFIKYTRGQYKTIILYKKNKQQVKILNNGGNVLNIRCDVLPLANTDMLILMRYSVNDILLTGDQSITDALSCCPTKNIFYQIAHWKTSFGSNLAKYLPNEFLKKKKTACGSVSAISYKSNYGHFIKQWDFRVVGKVKLDALMAYAVDFSANQWFINAIKSNRTVKTLKNKLIINMGKINSFFDKIYVINLYDKVERWEKMAKQFKSRGITVERFVAIDGRCKDQGEKGCLAKLKTFEMAYDIKISNRRKLPLKEIVPAASLTIGTILILRHMVRNNLKHILICEDDIELGRNFENKFMEGIKEIKQTKYENTWDLLYVGCGGKCGDRDVSFDKTSSNKHVSTLTQFTGEDTYVKYKNDLRSPCDGECNEISEHISIPERAGGSWCYAFSLKGAKKMLKLIDDDAGNHVDQIYQNLENKGGVVALAFNPPIVWHEAGAIRADTDIPWNY